MSTRLIPAGRGKTLAQFRETYGISERSWKRLRAKKDVPRLTWITSHKAIVRPEHEGEWLDRRTEPAPAVALPTDDVA